MTDTDRAPHGQGAAQRLTGVRLFGVVLALVGAAIMAGKAAAAAWRG
jgi:hypothetical protein